MAIFTRSGSDFDFRRAVGRVRTVFQASMHPGRPWISRLPSSARAMTMLALSLTCGYFANEASDLRAHATWYLLHRPSASVIHWAMRSKGFTQVKDPVVLSKVQRTLPGNFDEPGAIWQLGEWLTYYEVRESDDVSSGGIEEQTESIDSFKVYCRKCKQIPYGSVQWQPIGKGWDGFTQLMRALDAQKTPVVQTKTVWRDPREIQF